MNEPQTGLPLAPGDISAPDLDPALRYAIDVRAVDWAAKGLDLVDKAIGLTPRLHDPGNLLERGDIFLFNHFSRFETVYPPLFIYRKTGALTRSIAHQELFPTLDPALSALGAVPHALPGLLPFLAAEILRGRKVVIFPEGGMIKDHRVQDEDGRWAIFSPTARQNRPHHSGAAILGLLLEACKQRIRSLARQGRQDVLDRWAQTLNIASTDLLLERAAKPTLLIPGYITFFPVLPPERWMQQGVGILEKLRGAALPEKVSEELLVESGLLFRDTDMDIRLGLPLPAHQEWSRWEQMAVDRVFERISSLDELFDLAQQPERWLGQMTKRWVRHHAESLRDQWMGRLYRLITVNINHLLATLCVVLVEHGQNSIAASQFYRVMVQVVDLCRQETGLHLHETVSDPHRTAGMALGQCTDMKAFFRMAEEAGSLHWDGDTIHLSQALIDGAMPERVRLENPLRLAANQVTPLGAVRRAVTLALTVQQDMPQVHADQVIARALMANTLLAFEQEKHQFSGPAMAPMEGEEAVTADPTPYLWIPGAERNAVIGKKVSMGVVLVHGFLASPAELRPLGERLHRRGIAVLGVRLAGHGTSPHALRERTWAEWLDSVAEGVRILRPFCEQIMLVGFSTGGALSLILAANHPENVCGVISVSAPLRFADRRMALAPWLGYLDDATRWRPRGRGDGLAYRRNISEHPHINYAQIPIAALAELYRMTQALPRYLPQVHMPTLVIHGVHDPVVAPESAETIFAKVGSREKRLHWVHSARHGLVYDEIGDTIEQILGFVDSLRLRYTSPP